ncbi:MAG: hypothetical protein RLZZ511_3857 [Cyanobacteriota bacterium]
MHFGGAVGAGGFDVVDAEFKGTVDGGFEVTLVFGGNVGEGHVLPFVLITHAATGEDGHLQFCATKPTIAHGDGGVGVCGAVGGLRGG